MTAAEARTCDTCGRALHRNAGERADRYAARRHCDRTCRNIGRRDETTRAALAEARVCEGDACGELLVRGERERLHEFAVRRFCSDPCRRAARRGPGRPASAGPQVGEGDGRVCTLDGCDEPLVRRGQERPGKFAARKYCSRGCAQAARALHADVVAGPNAARARRRAQARAAQVEVPVQAGPWRPAAWRDPALRRGEARDPWAVERVESVFRRPGARVLAST